MGLFEGKEQKQLKKQLKEDEKAAERAAKVRAKLESYHLDSIDDEYAAECIDIISGIGGTGMIEFGTTLSGKAEDVAKLSYLRALVEQNWIIIRQLDRISKALEQK